MSMNLKQTVEATIAEYQALREGDILKFYLMPVFERCILEFTKAVGTRQQLEAQLKENEMVQSVDPLFYEAEDLDNIVFASIGV
jgi:hypothetical protein